MILKKKISLKGTVKFQEKNKAYICNKLGDYNWSYIGRIQCLDLENCNLIWTKEYYGLNIIYDEVDSFLILTNHNYNSIGVLLKSNGELLWSVNTKMLKIHQFAIALFPKLFNFYGGPFAIYNKNLLTKEGFLLELETGKKLDKLIVEKKLFKITEYESSYLIYKVNGKDINYKTNIRIKNDILKEKFSFDILTKIKEFNSLQQAATQYENSFIWKDNVYVLMKNKNDLNEWIQIAHYFLILDCKDYSIKFKYELGQFISVAFTYFDGERLSIECEKLLDVSNKTGERLLHLFEHDRSDVV